MTLERATKRFSLDVRHGEPQQAVIVPGREQRHDMGMLELGSELDLPSEPFDVDPGRQLRRQNLDDDLALQGPFRGDEYTRHAGASEFPFQEEIGIKRTLQTGLEFTHGGSRGGGDDQSGMMYRTDSRCVFP